jgi:hypothetical protein
MKKKRFIPFWLTKKSRETAGTDRKIAELEYYYEGKEKDLLVAETELYGTELRRRKIEIQFQYGDIDEYEKESQLANLETDKIDRELKILAVEKQFQKLSNYDFDKKYIELTKSDIEKEIALVGNEFKHGKITSLDQEKQIATLKQEPWVKIVDVIVDKENPGIGSVELDWNQPFVDMLAANGYAAPKPEQIIDLWFDELCKNIALNAYDGVGDFNEKLDLIEEMKQNNKPKRRGTKK